MKADGNAAQAEGLRATARSVLAAEGAALHRSIEGTRWERRGLLQRLKRHDAPARVSLSADVRPAGEARRAFVLVVAEEGGR